MIKLIITLMVSAFITCSGQSSYKDYSDKTPTVNSNNIFRSSENLYRIKIPLKWTIDRGNALGSEFIAKSQLDDASLSIVVANLSSQPSFSAHDVPIDKIEQSLKQNNPTSEILESEKQFLSNEKAMYVKYKFNYKVLDKSIDLICHQYTLIRGTRIFTITLQAQELTYPIYEKTFRETLESFTFEDF